MTDRKLPRMNEHGAELYFCIRGHHALVSKSSTSIHLANDMVNLHRSALEFDHDDVIKFAHKHVITAHTSLYAQLNTVHIDEQEFIGYAL